MTQDTEMIKTAPGFHNFTHVTSELPLQSHPISVQRVGLALWIHKQMKLGTHPNQHKDYPTGHTTNNIRYREPRKIAVGSDGLVHLGQQAAAAAWIVEKSTEEFVSTCFLVSDINSVGSYQEELGGIFRSLKYIKALGLTPHEVSKWCDNKRSVIDTNETPNQPEDMIRAEVDLVLAIHKLKNIVKFKLDCRHVYGHQDEQIPKNTTSRVGEGSSHTSSHESEIEEEKGKGQRYRDEAIINMSCDTLT